MKKVILSILSLFGAFMVGFIKHKELKGSDKLARKIKNTFTNTNDYTKRRIIEDISRRLN